MQGGQKYGAFLAACLCVCHHCVYTMYGVHSWENNYACLLACLTSRRIVTMSTVMVHSKLVRRFLFYVKFRTLLYQNWRSATSDTYTWSYTPAAVPLNFLRAKDVRITRRDFACANTFTFICFGSQWSCSRVGRAVVSSSVDRVPPSTSCSRNRLRSGLPITCQRLCASLHAVCQPSRSQQPSLTPCLTAGPLTAMMMMMMMSAAGWSVAFTFRLTMTIIRP